MGPSPSPGEAPIPGASPEASHNLPEVVPTGPGATFPADTKPVSGAIRTVRAEYSEHSGPLPDPRYFRELAKIYPEAPRIIIEEFRQQSEHRRAMEKAVIGTRSALARRSQIFGLTIGLFGLMGSFSVVALGYPQTGATIATTCVLSLVTVFVLGRESQKQERVEKEKVREQIRNAAPIESLEGGPAASGTSRPIPPAAEAEPPER